MKGRTVLYQQASENLCCGICYTSNQFIEWWKYIPSRERNFRDNVVLGTLLQPSHQIGYKIDNVQVINQTNTFFPWHHNI